MTNDAPEALYAAPSDNGWHAPYCGCAPSDGARKYICDELAQAEKEAAVAAERKACVDLCHSFANLWAEDGRDYMAEGAWRCAKHIEAQANTDALEAVRQEARAEALREAAELAYAAMTSPVNDTRIEAFIRDFEEETLEHSGEFIRRSILALIPADQEEDMSSIAFQ